MNYKVICDTNIWYNLGNDTIDPSSLKPHSLVATFYNFQELITTPNTLTNFQQVRRAAKAIVDYSSSQILENAYLHLAKQIDIHFHDKRDSYDLGMSNWTEIKHMAALSDTFQLTPN